LGVNTSSFTVALKAEPLSTVTVTFSSRFGGLAFIPASVAFDYTNFATAVTVAVSAVDDLVDQGFSYRDSVLALVASADSLSECLEADPPACGQAAKYADYSTRSGPEH
jgi:hypothetical protein